MNEQLSRLIRYHESLIPEYKARGLISTQTLEELTVRYLKVLGDIMPKDWELPSAKEE